MLDLKPIYNTGTITFVESPEKITLKKIDSTYIKDPKGVIPNGIYKVFKHEKDKQKFLIAALSLITIASIIWICLLSTVYLHKVNPFWFAPAGLIFLLVGWKLISVCLDAKHLEQSVLMYRESLQAGSRLTPPFISSLYIKLYKLQAKQNWIVIAIMFYGTIFTALFWWLQNVSWWIFDFKGWIHNLIKNPDIVCISLISVLVVTLIMHIYFTVYRKKRIIDIQSFFGNEVISQVEIDELVRGRNKVYRRAFFISILVVLILPFIGWIIYKKLIKKN